MVSIQINERGQLTIPKKMREQANIRPSDEVNIKVDKEGQIIISKRNIFDELDDLIKRDLINEGVAPYELKEKMAERKKELAKALNRIVDDVDQEIAAEKFTAYEELSKDLE